MGEADGTSLLTVARVVDNRGAAYGISSCDIGVSVTGTYSNKTYTLPVTTNKEPCPGTDITISVRPESDPERTIEETFYVIGTTPEDYVLTYSGDCSPGEGLVRNDPTIQTKIAAGESKFCTVTATYVGSLTNETDTALLTIVKTAEDAGGTGACDAVFDVGLIGDTYTKRGLSMASDLECIANPGQERITASISVGLPAKITRYDGTNQGAQVELFYPSAFQLTEVQAPNGTDPVVIFSGDCDTLGRVVLLPGDHKTCYVTNSIYAPYEPPPPPPSGCTPSTEICDGRDNDCDGQVDEGSVCCGDADGDGFNDASCGGTDCDDSNNTIYPGATEICDGLDNNCSGVADDGPDTDVDTIPDTCDNCPTDANADQKDSDYDGIGDACDLSDSTIPKVPTNFQIELIDSIYEEVPIVFLTWTHPVQNTDNTPLIDLSQYVVLYSRTPSVSFTNYEYASSTSASAVQNGWYLHYLPYGTWHFKLYAIDSFMNYSGPSGEVSATLASPCTDLDGDGYGTGETLTGCSGSTTIPDCNDSNLDVYPGSIETCDAIDNNCDGVVDEGFDQDGDGFTTCGGDCLDTNASVYPMDYEAACFDGLDNDCNGLADGLDGACVVVPTTTGSDVSVTPIDPVSGTSPASISFDNVTAAGTTSVTTSGTGQTAPDNFKLGDPPTYYDISTTAGVSGAVTICIEYGAIAYADESKLELAHFNTTAGLWEVITDAGYPDIVNNIICGTSASLSPFAVFEVNLPPTAVAGLDQTVEATSLDGALVTLDGSGSSDPDSDPLVFTWFDLSGNTIASGIQPAVTLPLGLNALTLAVTDPDGATSMDNVQVIVEDTTPPVLTLPDGVTVVAAASITIVDIGSAIATDIFPVTITNDAPVAGFPMGITAVTWTASDSNGNETTATQTIHVVYDFGGFLSPLVDGKVYKLGRTLPLKFQLFFAGGSLVDPAYATVTLQQLSSGEPVGDPIIIESTSGADSGNTFRFADDQYIYNLSTSGLAKGTYWIIVDLHDDSQVRKIEIGLR